MANFIILCGGIGKRNNQYSLPKPLNYINGKHMIEYIIEKIPSNEIFIIYNISLEQYNFEEIIKNSSKNKTFHFSKVDYLTRGAVESAYVGIQSLHTHLNNLKSLVFLDNDNIHNFNEIPYSSFNGNFIGYGKNYDRTNYSFITIQENNITNIEEKVKISDDYCCGIYGFANIETFNNYARKLIENNNKTKNEFYFSQLYKIMLLDKQFIKPILINETKHIGTFDEIIKSIDVNTTFDKLRICFDLDNTLVTYPTKSGDYTTVKPIDKNIKLLHFLKKQGHEIIIHTARRMKTHNHNIGKVTKDIARITLDTLDQFNIEYDEIIFGKPIADIYIDDRSINPYINDISFFGIFIDKNEYIPNKIENNKYNTIKKYGNQITKTGPYSFMKGELYFYQNIPKELQIYFPSLIDFNKQDNKLDITVDYIEGIPLFYLYKNQLITEKHIDNLLTILDCMHNYQYPITISNESIKNNYFAKLASRFNKNDYYFDNANEIYGKIISMLEKTYNPKITGIIHGDFWFSNIILDYQDNIKCLDMKGQVDGILTLNGDKYYDYGKLLQSILGYDLVLNNCDMNVTYIEKITKYYLDKCSEKGLNIDYLKAVTINLIFGTLPFIESAKMKNNVWIFLCELII